MISFGKERFALCILPSIDLTATGARIAQLRQQAGLTVRDLQDIFGFNTPQAIYRWQRGLTLPTLDNLVALASVFGTTMDAIIVRAGTADRTRSA